jgi:hypothetical protein
MYLVSDSSAGTGVKRREDPDSNPEEKEGRSLIHPEDITPR